MSAKYLLLLAASALLINRASSDTNHRLNSQITPIHYSIIITPYFNTGDALAFTFDGAVSISLETNATDVNKIRLHAQDLEISVSNVTLTSDTSAIGLNPANPLEFNANYSFVDINLEVPLQAGVRYTLAISYRGPIREDLNGFYRSSYVENGETKWLGATQMEPTHARKVFPCFDEPQYKATFSLSIDRPATYRQCLTNTKWQTSITLSNGYIRDVFTTTPKMSTYLVAFTVSELVPARQSIIGNREFAVYTRPDAVNQSDYAFDFGMRVEAALSNFFGIDYYSTDDNLKLDHVALTDFRAGAMENWGLIKYREALLLYVPEESTPYYKYRVAQIIAHETTHMWFGNLVTCHWWSNTWLNEGFANYFQDYITSLIEPDVRSANKLVTGSVYSAYAADEVPTAPAITNNDVNSPAEISAHFGTITYQKAGSVIRMIHHFIGDEAFRIGLNAYLQANQFSSGYPELLYGALTQGVQNTSSLANYPGVSLRQVMSEWIWQPGHPVLEVDVDYETGEVTLKQERFYSSSEFSSTEIYPIPITYTMQGEADFNNTKPAFVMNNESYVLNATGVLNHSWIIFNIQETGLYRVNYDRHTWQLLAQTLKGEERTRIHHLNRAKIVNDLFAFLTADKVDFDLLHEVIGFLANENDNSVWLAAISGLNNLRTRFIGSDVLDDLDSYILTLMANITNELGYEVRATDDFETLENRMQVLNFACKLGHQGCIDNAVELFQAFRVNGTRISPSLRPVAYCNGLRHGSGEDYDFLWGELLSTNVGNEALVIQSALGCTRVQAKLQEYLESVTQEGSPIRSQDVTTPVSSILSDHANLEFVLNSLKSNYSVWSNTYPSMGTVLNYITAGLHTTTQFEEFESWLSNCVECSEDVIESAATSLASAKASAAWATEHRSDILHTLRNEAVGVAPSMGILLVASLVVGVRSM